MEPLQALADRKWIKATQQLSHHHAGYQLLCQSLENGQEKEKKKDGEKTRKVACLSSTVTF